MRRHDSVGIEVINIYALKHIRINIVFSSSRLYRTSETVTLRETTSSVLFVTAADSLNHANENDRKMALNLRWLIRDHGRRARPQNSTSRDQRIDTGMEVRASIASAWPTKGLL